MDRRRWQASAALSVSAIPAAACSTGSPCVRLLIIPLRSRSKNSADTLIGSIGVSTTATTYNTSSDERLKEDLKTFDAGRVIDDTEVYDFAWRSTGERSYGVLAQQAVDVYPAAVTYEEKQDWWGIDYSKYVPVLLQELKALRARVAALEGGGLSGKPA